MAAAVALNVADDDPDGIASDAGTLSSELLDDRFTVTPPVGALAVSVTVQVVAAPDDRLDGEHWTVDKAADGITVSVPVCAVPPKVAEIVTPVEAVTAEVVMLKAA